MWRIDQTQVPPGVCARRDALRVGFVPLCDCAPLVVAYEAGLFRKYSLPVELVREVGWATVRDKIVHGQLEAAHALAAMPFAATLGIGSVRRESVTGLVLNLQGNAVGLALRYWKEGVRDARGFGEFVRQQTNRESLVFGVVSPVSSHRLLMERWLTQAGLVAGRDYELAVVPPPQVPDVIRSGHLAGFCVGEPWNSVAVEQGLAWCPAVSSDLAPGHVEKVLLVTEQFARQRAEEHRCLIAAVLEACVWCADPAHHEGLSRLLAQRRYVNAPAELIRRSFSGVFRSGPGLEIHSRDFTVYHAGDSNAPTFERGLWVLKHLVPTGNDPRPLPAAELVRKVFRSDLFQAACAREGPQFQTPSHQPTTELEMLNA